MLRRRLLPFALALCSGCGAEPAPPAAAPRSAILITLDTTRADALDSFGGAHHLTPNLDALAAQSVRYLQARTVAPLTLPAHASMFTGLYPPQHTVRGNGPTTLPDELVTLAERAARAGVATAGFVGGLTLDRAYGAAQGFEVWTQPTQSAARELGQISDRPASAVVADARAWFASRDRARPFFLWVHVFDAHAPYAPPRSFLDLAGGDAYLGEIAASDAALGLLFDDLRREHVLDTALLVVCADHGEARGDHGEDTHGLHVWDATLRVPFFVRHPGGARAGEASDETVSVVDVAPTIIEWLGLEAPAPGECDGVSLLHAVGAERGTYFESFSGWARFGWSPLVGWIDREGKYVHSSKPQLFRTRGDPGEERDVLGEHAELAARDVARLRAIVARGSAGALSSRLAPVGAIAGAIAELGYGDAGEIEPDYPDPFTLAELPPPRERLAEYREFIAAQSLNQTGHFAEAAAKLEALVAANPRGLHLLDELATSLEGLQQWALAIEVLGERARRPPDRIATHQKLVRCYTELGDAAKAREHTLRALDLMIETCERRGEREEAESFRRLRDEERARGR